MDLSIKKPEHLDYMIETIKKKLKMAAIGAINSSHFAMEYYDDIKDIYEVVASKEKFSISEVELIVSELGKLRKV